MAKGFVKTFRVDGGQAARLAAMAKATKRTQSDVMRLLIDAAYIDDKPQVVLDSQTQRWLDERLETILAGDG